VSTDKFHKTLELTFEPTQKPYRNSLQGIPIQEQSQEYRVQPNEDKETMTKEKKSKHRDPLKSQAHETMRPTSDSSTQRKEQKTLVNKRTSHPHIE
jgi:hypothetical protein